MNPVPDLSDTCTRNLSPIVCHGYKSQKVSLLLKVVILEIVVVVIIVVARGQKVNVKGLDIYIPPLT